MERAKKQRLEARGWRIGGAEEFLNLTLEEKEYVELKLALARRVRERRQESSLTQVEMARVLKSSQSRVAKMEGGDPSVSLDLLIRSLIVLGASKKELARIISNSSNP